MKKLLAILVFVCLAVGKAGAQSYQWTDANGVTWDYYQQWDYNYSMSYWAINGASGYSGIVNVPSTVSDGYSTYTIDAFSGYAFNGCQVKLPSTIKYIQGLMTSGIISIDAATPPILEKGPEVGSSQSGVTILVPEANLSTYRNAAGWKNLEVNIISQSAKTDYDINVTAISNSSGIHAAIGEDNLVNVMTMKVTGTINSYDIMIMRNKMHNLHYLDLTDAKIVANSYPYLENYSTIDNVLGDKAFMEMNKLITVKLPKTIKAIGDRAFSGCNGLQNVEFQEGLKTIGYGAFSGCNLQSAVLKNGLESIGMEAFYCCSNLKTVQLKNGLSSIGSSAFYSCSSLTTIEIPEGVTRGKDGEDNNICFTLAEAGDVTVTYTGEVFTIAGNFYVEPAGDPTVAVIGDMTEWAAEIPFILSEDKKTATLYNDNIKAGTYEFKLIVNGEWRSNGYTFHRDFTSAEGITENVEANMVVIIDVEGEYTFTWTFETNKLEITFPEKGQGIEEILSEGKSVKVIREGNLIILKGDKAYNAMGQIVK